MSDTTMPPAEQEESFSVFNLLPARELDYKDPAVQYALDCEAERRLRLRGLLGPAACKDLRGRIIKKFRTDNKISSYYHSPTKP